MIGGDLNESLSVLADTNGALHRCCDSGDGDGLDVVPRSLLLPGAGRESALMDAMVKVGRSKRPDQPQMSDGLRSRSVLIGIAPEKQCFQRRSMAEGFAPVRFL